MSATDNTENDAFDIDADEVTLAASDDVVAQIRAQAKQLRSEAAGEADTADVEPVKVWTAASDASVEPHPVVITDADVSWSEEPTGPGPAIRRESADVEMIDVRAQAVASQPASVSVGSLIDGAAPPASSTTFWNTGEQITPAPRLAAPQRRSAGVPLWALVTIVAVVIVLAAVGIAVALASTGPVT